jgi:hypothetical protein
MVPAAGPCDHGKRRTVGGKQARGRDAWQVDHTLGKYVISDEPMTEEEWTRQRATLIDVTPDEEKKD